LEEIGVVSPYFPPIFPISPLFSREKDPRSVCFNH
jgi:hypothetical protein